MPASKSVPSTVRTPSSRCPFELAHDGVVLSEVVDHGIVHDVVDTDGLDVVDV